MLVIAIHPCTVADKSSYVHTVEGGHISRQELAGIYIIKRRDILNDESVPIAAVFPKASCPTLAMALRRANVDL